MNVERFDDLDVCVPSSNEKYAFGWHGGAGMIDRIRILNDS